MIWVGDFEMRVETVHVHITLNQLNYSRFSINDRNRQLKQSIICFIIEGILYN